MYNILVGLTKGKKPLGTPWYRGENNFKIGLKEIGCKDIDWIYLLQVIVQWPGPCVNKNELLCSIKIWEYFGYLSNY
jgi:hypothetical protein